MNAITVASADRELRAGFRVLAGLMSHPHPMVRRAINESLVELRWKDLQNFTDQCEAALLEAGPTEPRPAHLTEMRDQYDATEARD